MLETEDFEDIASIYALETGPVRKVMQGHPEKKMDFQIFSVINQKCMASCRVLNCGYFGTKSKAIGQVEEELWFCCDQLEMYGIMKSS